MDSQLQVLLLYVSVSSVGSQCPVILSVVVCEFTGICSADTVFSSRCELLSM